MATERLHLCSKSECGHKQSPALLFDALRDVARGNSFACPKCGSPCHLQLAFSFALGVGSHPCRVLAAFLPEQIASWQDGDATVEFYPFLVVTEYPEGQAFWLPYWHVVNKKGHIKTKYGQWAPYLDRQSFISLLAQAKAKGYTL